nr:TatD family hydrolase [Candidatus Levybacteria bacterium]
MIDVHCHLNFHSFENDFDEVIKRAHESGVEKIINVGTSLESSQKAVELAKNYENLYSIVGIHPHHADKLESGWEKELETIAKNKKVLAIGEIGLDYFSYKSNGIVNPSLQKKIFETQIQMAHKLKLPLQIHNRQAGKDILEILKSHKNILKETPGMFHCFAGEIKILKTALALGFYIGFDGNITYNGIAPGENTSLKDLVGYTPLERIVTETDAPFLTPIPKRGSRNEPSYVIIVGETIAKIKNTSFSEVDKITTQNAMSLFKLNAMR